METKFNIKLERLENKSNTKLSNYIKALILINAELKSKQIITKIDAANQNLNIKLMYESFKKEFNQLLNGNKVLYFRKLASFLYEQLVKSISFKKHDHLFINCLKPNPLTFKLLYVDKDHKGISSTKINYIIDYLNFIKDECSLIIHLNKKGLIKRDIFLNYLISINMDKEIQFINIKNEKKKEVDKKEEKKEKEKEEKEKEEKEKEEEEKEEEEKKEEEKKEEDKKGKDKKEKEEKTDEIIMDNEGKIKDIIEKKK